MVLLDIVSSLSYWDDTADLKKIIKYMVYVDIF